MRTDDSKKPRRATKLQIGALSAVDVPAHSGALAKVMKVRVRKTAAAAAEQEETNKMTDQEMVPEAAPEVAPVEAEKAANPVEAKLAPLNAALSEQVARIEADESITDKAAAVAEAVAGYTKAVHEAMGLPVADVGVEVEAEKAADPEQADDEELTTDDGVTVKKSAIGEAGYKLLKAATLAKRAAEDALDMERLQKRAADELGNLTGDNVIKAKLLKCMRAMPQDEREYLERVLKSANAAAAEGFEAKAIKNADIVSDKPDERLDQLADAYAAEHKVTKAVAVSRVLTTDEGRRLYKQLENQEAS